MYAIGYKVCMQKIADLIGAKDIHDPLVDHAISDTFGLINRSAYLRVVAGCEPPGPDGKRKNVLVIALATGPNRDELEKKELGEPDDSIKAALPHVLVGPGIWEID